jgi:spore coat protein A
LKRVTLAPAERADLIVDFEHQRGQKIVLKNDAYDVLEFRVAPTAVPVANGMPASLGTMANIPEREAVRTRLLTLTGPEDADDATARRQPMLLNNSRWRDPVTESPTLGSVEIWSFINLTDDAHPIHLHLVRFQILDRRAFDMFTYLNEKIIRYTDDPVPPEPNEAGWKDTVRADPGMVTRIIIRFEGYAGRYVWHCHMLEHEDNEMMRPYEVIGR